MKRNILVGLVGVAVLAALLVVWTLGSPGPAAARDGEGTPTAQRTAQFRSPDAAKQQLEEEIALTRFRQELALRRVARQQDALLAAEDKVREKEIELQLLRARLKRLAESPISQKELDAMVAKDREVERLTQALAETTQLLSETAAILAKGKDHPQYKQMLQEREDLQEELARRRDEVRPNAVAEIRQLRQGQLEREIAAVEEEILARREAAAALKDVLEKAINQFREKSLAPGDAALNAKLADIETKLTTTDSKLTTLDGKLMPLDGKLNQILSRLEKIEKRLEKIEPPKK